jgi:hypothetical protein
LSPRGAEHTGCPERFHAAENRIASPSSALDEVDIGLADAGRLWLARVA